MQSSLAALLPNPGLALTRSGRSLSGVESHSQLEVSGAQVPVWRSSLAGRHPCVAFCAERHPSNVGGGTMRRQQGGLVFSGERCRLSRPGELTCCCTSSPVHSLAQLRRRRRGLHFPRRRISTVDSSPTQLSCHFSTSQRLHARPVRRRPALEKNYAHRRTVAAQYVKKPAHGGLLVPRVATQTRVSQQYSNSSTFIDATMESKISVPSDG